MERTIAELQETILETLCSLSSIESETLILHIIELALYFIMIPTSRHSLMSVQIFITIERKQKTKIKTFYGRFRKELCRTIAELCAINQALINRSLRASLQKIGVQLGFTSTKDFVAQECEYLLRILVPLIVEMPRVRILISEMANLIGIELPQFLASKYAGVFLHVYLNESEDVFKQAMTYLERETGMTGPVLRKTNLRVILNELLLNFHINHEKVLQLLKLLVEEDSQESKVFQEIQDYLQSLLLGVLLNFDRKLEKQCERKNGLLSLTQLFRLDLYYFQSNDYYYYYFC